MRIVNGVSCTSGEVMLSTGRLLFNDVLLMSTSSTVAGYKIVKTIGLVSGSTVRTRDAVKDIRSGLQSLFGGELDQYTSLMHESRQEAIDRMKEATLGKGGNAIVGVRFNSSNIAANACEVMVYGTAVSVEEESMTKTMKNSSK